jgi:5-methylcytosine-specific restriction endonuclease McrA
MPKQTFNEPTDPRKTLRWQQLRAQVLAEERVCFLCGGAIQFAARPRSTWAPSVDHIIPLAAGGLPYARHNVRAVHAGCNARKKDKQFPPIRTSRTI